MTPEQEKIVESLSGLAAYEIKQIVDHITETHEILGASDYEELQEDFDRLLDENVNLSRELSRLTDELSELRYKLEKLNK